MTPARLVARSLRFYWRTHLGVLAGAAVATAVLVGALVVGDSVRGSLRQMALARLGGTRLALAPAGRFFRGALAGDLSRSLGAQVAAVLRLEAVASAGKRRAGKVQVLGVDGRFWELGRSPDALKGAAPDGVVLNERLAGRLGVAPGDRVVLRLENPSAMPIEAPLASDADSSIAAEATVTAIASDDGIGRFGLRAEVTAPYNAFVPLAWLAEKVARPGAANLLLVGAGTEDEIPPEAAASALRRDWSLQDAELQVRTLPIRGAVELYTPRVFLDPAAARAAITAAPGAVGILTYFVNEVRLGDRATPYSMVSAVGDPAPEAPATHPAAWPGSALTNLIPADLGDDEIVINDWLAADLSARPGDWVEMRYFVVGAMRTLREETSRFRVRAVVPLAGAADDPELMPAFPGLAKAQTCDEWKPGIPIELARIRDQDRRYWDRHKGTPKAFVSLRAGQRMWSNPFGELTALRWPMEGGSESELARRVRDALAPADLGLFFQPVRAEALEAARKGQDFGQLFLGLSVFLIASAVLLMGLMFALGMHERRQEVGALVALGFRPGRVRRLLLTEGALLAVAGAAVGTLGGLLYTHLVLHALSTLWRGAVAGASLRYHAEPATLATGAFSAVAAAVATMWAVLLRQGRRAPRVLLDGPGPEVPVPVARRVSWPAAGLAAAAAGTALWRAISAGPGRDPRAAAEFFLAGALLLVAGLAAAWVVLGGRAGAGEGRMTLAGLALRSAARRRGRSLAVVALLACGSFLVIAVGANRRDALAGADRRSSGTGGFTYYGESALPITRDLNSPEGREAYGLDPRPPEGVGVVALKVREGDDASCLNLNRAQRPRLLGVVPGLLASRGAFTFTRTLAAVPEGRSPWSLLDEPAPDGAVPAIGDEPTITWALGLAVGDALEYPDERGSPRTLRIVGSLAGSILQGNLVISEANFRRLFPSVAGARALLVDCPPAKAEAMEELSSPALQDLGLELTPAAERLAIFQAVENTYLSVFQVLGGLGLVLGSVGLGVVVYRNVMERRGELAMLRAVGFSRRDLRGLVAIEHWWLLGAGLACGAVAAGVAVLPVLRSPGAMVPYASLLATLAAVVVCGGAWTLLAAVLALRGPLLSALRNE